jgi:hypothetical protein
VGREYPAADTSLCYALFTLFFTLLFTNFVTLFLKLFVTPFLSVKAPFVTLFCILFLTHFLTPFVTPFVTPLKSVSLSMILISCLILHSSLRILPLPHSIFYTTLFALRLLLIHPTVSITPAPSYSQSLSPEKKKLSSPSPGKIPTLHVTRTPHKPSPTTYDRCFTDSMILNKLRSLLHLDEKGRVSANVSHIGNAGQTGNTGQAGNAGPANDGDSSSTSSSCNGTGNVNGAGNVIGNGNSNVIGNTNDNGNDNGNMNGEGDGTGTGTGTGTGQRDYSSMARVLHCTHSIAPLLLEIQTWRPLYIHDRATLNAGMASKILSEFGLQEITMSSSAAGISDPKSVFQCIIVSALYHL